MNHLQIYFICSLARSLARHSYVARSLHALSFPLQWIRSILWAFHKGAYEIPFTVYTGARSISVLIVRNVYGWKYWIVSFRSHSNRCSHFVRLFHCRSLYVLNSLCQSIALFHSVKNMTLDCLHPPEREKNYIEPKGKWIRVNIESWCVALTTSPDTLASRCRSKTIAQIKYFIPSAIGFSYEIFPYNMHKMKMLSKKIITVLHCTFTVHFRRCRNTWWYNRNSLIWSKTHTKHARTKLNTKIELKAQNSTRSLAIFLWAIILRFSNIYGVAKMQLRNTFPYIYVSASWYKH